MALGLNLSWFLKFLVEFRYIDSLKSYTSFVTIIIGVKKTIMRKRKLTDERQVSGRDEDDPLHKLNSHQQH